MKKNLSKLFAMALALIMVMALTVPAFAAETESGLGGDGTITVNDPKIGATYSIYKVFDATYGNGTAAYEVDGASDWYKGLKDGNVFSFSQIPGTSTFRVSSNQTGATIGEALRQVVETYSPDKAAADITTSENDNVVKWIGLTDGYYLVVSNVEGIAEAVVSLDNVNGNNAVVNEKNEGPNWGDNGKTILVNGVATEDAVSVNYGDVVTFQITINATNYDGYDKINKYVVYDNLPDGMQLTNEDGTVTTATISNISVRVNDEDYIGTAVLGGAGSKQIGSESSPRAYDFYIEIPWIGDDGEFLYSNNDNTIVITYYAKVTTDAAVSTALLNNAWFDWADGNDGGHSTPDSATVYTYAVAIQKVDGKDGSALEGVKFKVTNEDGQYVVATESTVSGEDGVYIFSEFSTEGTEFETGEDGQIIIKGLAAGDYTFTETYALPGYNVADPVTVSGVVGGQTTTTWTVYYDEDGNKVAQDSPEIDQTKTQVYELDYASCVETIENNTGTVLPSTGGIGTTLFYTIGGVLVVCAGVLLVTKKRMNNMEG